MKPSGEDLLRLCEILDAAFSPEEMIALALSFDFEFERMTKPGSMPARILEMISYMQSRSQLGRLLDAAKRERETVNELRSIVSHLNEATNLSFQQRQQLVYILESRPISPQLVETFYLDAWPILIPNRRSVQKASDAAIQLAGIPVESGTTAVEKYPILVFVERIAALWRHTGEDSAASSLTEWFERVAESWSLSPSAIEQLRTAAHSSRPALNHLLIQFHPQGIKFRLEAYLWRNGHGCVIGCDEQWRDVPELPAAVDSIVMDAERIAGQGFVVEFQVPESLLAQDFDRWMIKMEPEYIPIGGWYPVVVRFLERLNPGFQRIILRWKEKWRTLANAGKPEFYWIDEVTANPRAVLGSLSAPAGPHCAALGFAMPSCSKVSPAVVAALSAGVPVLVWFRRPIDTGDLRLELEEAIANLNALEQLPNLIYDYRVKHAGDESHPANHFTLFFDDADRVPPPKSLTSETSRQG